MFIARFPGISPVSLLERFMSLLPLSITRNSALIVIATGVLLLSGCNPSSQTQSPVATENQSPSQLVSIADYQRAESMLAVNTSPLVRDTVLAQYWQDDDSLIYRRSTEDGSEYVRLDLEQLDKTLFIDNNRLADALIAVADADSSDDDQPDRNDLILTGLELMESGDLLQFRHAGEDYQLQLSNYQLNKLVNTVKPEEFQSPDKSKAVFIQDYNLWLRDIASNEITQLTFDGEIDYGYGTNNAGWIRDEGPVLLWSPDSTKIATFQHDGRNVEEMYLYSTKVGHPALDAWKYPLPGDDYIFQIERVVIHLDTQPRVVRLNMSPDPHRSTTADHVAGSGGRFLDVEWSEDSSNLAFISSSRDHKIAEFKVADPDTGEVRTIFTETAQTYYESGSSSQNWRYLSESNEFIWFSERDNWGHLYLYDLVSGELKQQLTSGSWTVLQVHQVDKDNRVIYFSASDPAVGDPYFSYLYRVHLDGSGLEKLSPEIANHSITWSESGNYFVDTYSTPTQAPVSVLKNRDGEELLVLEQGNIDALLASGWVPPVPFSVKARDQITDLYGLMYKPSDFDANNEYPILNYLYPGPQSGSVGSRSFRASRNDKQALAELGFIVVEVDAMGTPGRSKALHDIYYGDMGDNGLPDQITMIQQLAAQYPWMDLERVGIWGHSGGGFASTAGILRYPDFYKVAVSGAGNHDNRNYEDDWGEKWQGLLETYPETDLSDADSSARAVSTNYDSQANQLLADRLRGKLLLAHGLLDTNVHPSSTLLLVQALIDADKDFDLLVLPNAGHGFGNRRYFMKRRWDYFVEHLIGARPPSDFIFAQNIP